MYISNSECPSDMINVVEYVEFRCKNFCGSSKQLDLHKIKVNLGMRFLLWVYTVMYTSSSFTTGTSQDQLMRKTPFIWKLRIHRVSDDSNRLYDFPMHHIGHNMLDSKLIRRLQLHFGGLNGENSSNHSLWLYFAINWISIWREYRWINANQAVWLLVNLWNSFVWVNQRTSVKSCIRCSDWYDQFYT